MTATDDDRSRSVPGTRRQLVDGGAVGVGILAALGVAVPAVVLAQVLDASGDDGIGAASGPIAGVIFVGVGLGGFVSARRRGRAPLVDGTLAAVVAYLVVQVLTVVRLTVSDDEVTWAAIPLFVLVAAAVGLVGALVGDRAGRS